MLFNSFLFLWLFPLIFIAHYFLQYVTGKSCALRLRIRNIFLLTASYLIYIKCNPCHAFVLFGVTLVTYSSAIFIERRKLHGQRLWLFATGVVLAALPLVVFKYSTFIATTLNGGLTALGLHGGMVGLNLAIPLGISFFTLQALGYLYDVYSQKISAERNIIDYFLFVSFFPQIASGPISKAKDLLPQIKSVRKFDYAEAVQGLKWLLWGCFMKVVVADRLGLYIDRVLSDYANYGGTDCLVYCLMYAMQIYCDFAGYSFMAVGTGQLLGFRLINNFQRPYLSVSVTEFWHRWHISLSQWLRDYIYIPLGGSRCSRAKNYVNILITFLVSGIWHGANWTFIVWGTLHGLFQVLEKALNAQKVSNARPLYRTFRIVLTFVLVDAAWVFFRMPTIDDAVGVISKIVVNQDFTISQPGAVALLMMLVVVAKDLADEYVPQLNPLHSRHILIRWSAYMGLILSILLFGVFDAGQFIYARF